MSAGDLTSLERLSVQELRAEWARRLGGEAPALRTRELMKLALAYRLQAKAQGELSGTMKRRAAELARRFTADRNYTPVAGPALKPGSSIIKAYRGVRHEVMVLEEGFGYLGERFGTLSEVAFRITGTKWNGYIFFGLKVRTR